MISLLLAQSKSWRKAVAVFESVGLWLPLWRFCQVIGRGQAVVFQGFAPEALLAALQSWPWRSHGDLFLFTDRGSSFSGSPGSSFSHWFGTLRTSWLLLCLLLLLQEELLYSLFLCSSLTGVIIDAAKASRAAFYCLSQAAELIISGRIDQSESRKVLSAVAVEFQQNRKWPIWFTHCEMLSFNNSLCFNPSSSLTVCDVRRFCCSNNTLVQPCAFS